MAWSHLARGVAIQHAMSRHRTSSPEGFIGALEAALEGGVCGRLQGHLNAPPALAFGNLGGLEDRESNETEHS